MGNDFQGKKRKKGIEREKERFCSLLILNSIFRSPSLPLLLGSWNLFFAQENPSSPELRFTGRPWLDISRILETLNLNEDSRKLNFSFELPDLILYSEYFLQIWKSRNAGNLHTTDCQIRIAWRNIIHYFHIMR